MSRLYAPVYDPTPMQWAALDGLNGIRAYMYVYYMHT